MQQEFTNVDKEVSKFQRHKEWLWTHFYHFAFPPHKSKTTPSSTSTIFFLENFFLHQDLLDLLTCNFEGNSSLKTLSDNAFYFIRISCKYVIVFRHVGSHFSWYAPICCTWKWLPIISRVIYFIKSSFLFCTQTLLFYLHFAHFIFCFLYILFTSLFI